MIAAAVLLDRRFYLIYIFRIALYLEDLYLDDHVYWHFKILERDPKG